MTRNTILPALILCSFMFAACSPENASTETVQTETISPATIPASDSDTQLPTTQTTEIGDERSPNEGGVPGEDEASSPTPSPSPSPSPS